MCCYLQNVLLVPLRYGADGDGGELGFLLVHDVRRNVGGLAHEEFQAFVYLQTYAGKLIRFTSMNPEMVGDIFDERNNGFQYKQ